MLTTVSHLPSITMDSLKSALRYKNTIMTPKPAAIVPKIPVLPANQTEKVTTLYPNAFGEEPPAEVKRKFSYGEPKEEQPAKPGPFRSARQEMSAQRAANRTQSTVQRPPTGLTPALGTEQNKKRRFASPMLHVDNAEEDKVEGNYGGYTLGPPRGRRVGKSSKIPQKPIERAPAPSERDERLNRILEDDRMRGIDAKLVETVLNEVIGQDPNVTWEDIAGLEFAKKCVMEIVVWPMLRPDLFTGLRGPPKGLLLFGPPGTGKTMIGKAIASQSGATFFSISASSLMSKWVGEGEKMVRALFAVARVEQPAVIFVDEIDSLLSQRSEGDFEASRRVKTEFLVQLDGAATSTDDKILFIGATNRPQELDEAARRRLVKKLYIPLPDGRARLSLVRHLLSSQPHAITEADMEWIVEATDGYSGADVRALCTEAALGPIRDLSIGGVSDITTISLDSVRLVMRRDFSEGLKQARASVSSTELDGYHEWNALYGSFPAETEGVMGVGELEVE